MGRDRIRWCRPAPPSSATRQLSTRFPSGCHVNILAIESSCDETAAAVLADGQRLLANVINSQIAVHGRYGGVVPELASRKHVENIYPVVNEALATAGIGLSAIDAIAVTRGPGLIGSLLVGLSFAKALAYVTGVPCIGIDHMAAHLTSIFFSGEDIRFPCVTLVASGGHTSIYLMRSAVDFTLIGRTRDDAAGEAFDKVAKVLGLDYPGGPVISRLAADGDPDAIPFPRAWLEKDSLDFSFSGLKTAVALHVRGKTPAATADICASFQEAVVDVLTEKTMQAVRRHGAVQVAIAGGVAANPRLRQRIRKKAAASGVAVAIPPVEFCTDNAAMVARAAAFRLDEATGLDLGMDVYSRAVLVS